MIYPTQNQVQEALDFAEKFNIHINQDFDVSYEKIVCMIEDNIVFTGTRADAISWLRVMGKRTNQILSLLKSESIDPSDYDAAVKSLSETVQAKANIEAYTKYIYPIASRGVLK